MIVLSNGQRFEIENPAGVRSGILRQRERNILPLTFKAEENRFEEIKQAFLNMANTETVTVYFPSETENATDEQLEGVAHEVYEGYTISGEIKDAEIVIEKGTLSQPTVYGRQLTIEMGQRQFGE